MTKIILVILAVLSCVLGFMGFRGFNIQSGNGFKQQGMFQAVYRLSGDTLRAWKELEGDLGSLSSEDQEKLDTVCMDFLSRAWETVIGEGAGQDAVSLMENEDADRQERLFRLLYATCTPYLTNGKLKLAKTARDAVLSIPASELSGFRARLLRSLTDPEEAVPEELGNAAEGDARVNTLLQSLFVTAGSCNAASSDDAAVFRKEIASSETSREVKEEAFVMTARHGISGLWNLIVSNAKLVIILSFILLFDTVLLALLMAGERRWVFDIKWILILVIIDFLLYFLLMPMAYLVFRSFTEDDHFSFARFARLFSNPDNRTALRNTLVAASSTMVLGTLLAFPLAWLVGRTNLYGKTFFRSLFVLTYMVPPYVGAMAWQQLLNPNAGTVNKVLRMVFHLGGSRGPLNIYTLPGLIWVLTTFYYPYAFITISRAMEKMDPSLEEASRVSGASPFKTLLRITVPMMTPSLIAGALLVFVSAASCYGIPSIIASGTKGLRTVTTRIAEIYSSGQQNLSDAIGLSVILMGIALLILFLSDVVLARKQYITVSGKSVQPVIVDLKRLRVPVTILVSLFVLIVVFLPFCTILSISLKSDMGKSLFKAGNFTWSNWITVFTNAETLKSLKNSLIFAFISATAGILIAWIMSYLMQRTRVRGRSIPNFMITLGSGTPSVVIALGLIMTMGGLMGLNITGTAAIIIIAYMIKYLMMGMRTVSSSMSQIHVSLEESSQISGASWLRTMRSVTGPLILPSIAAGWFLIFIPCFYELTMTVLLFSSSTKTIGVQLYDYWTIHSKPVGCAMAFGILLIVAALNLLMRRITRGKFSI